MENLVLETDESGSLQLCWAGLRWISTIAFNPTGVCSKQSLAKRTISLSTFEERSREGMTLHFSRSALKQFARNVAFLREMPSMTESRDAKCMRHTSVT